MTRRRPVTLLVAAVVVALLVTALAACGGDDGSVDTSADERPTTTTTAATDTTAIPTTGGGTATGTVPPAAAGVDLRVVFLDGGRVATGHRRVAPTQAVARAALEQLVAGPNPTEQAAGFATVIRPETEITGLTIADGVATVTLAPDFGRGYSSDTAHQAEAQVVYTLTQFPSVEQVRFGTGGTPRTRADYRDVTPAVFVESVAPGDVVSSPVRVAGDANTFEATVRIRVLGADGAILADVFTTATSGTGEWGTFSDQVSFAKGANATGTVVVFWDSPKDGSPQDVQEIPVTFS